LNKKQKKTLKMHNREKRKKTTYDEAKAEIVSKNEPLKP